VLATPRRAPRVLPCNRLAKRVPPARAAGSATAALLVASSALGGLESVGVDLLLADLFADLMLVGDRLLAKADALLGHDVLLHDGLLLVQDDLVLLLGCPRRTSRDHGWRR